MRASMLECVRACVRTCGRVNCRHIVSKLFNKWNISFIYKNIYITHTCVNDDACVYIHASSFRYIYIYICVDKRIDVDIEFTIWLELAVPLKHTWTMMETPTNYFIMTLVGEKLHWFPVNIQLPFYRLEISQKCVKTIVYLNV